MTPYSLVTTVLPADEPVSLTLAKQHLRIDHDTEDELIGAWLRAARQMTEEYTGRRWAPQTLRMVMPRFPDGAIELPVDPVTGVTSITYRDENGVNQTLATSAYQTWLDHSPPLICPSVDDVTWPNTEVDKLEAVTVTFTAGYTEVPEMVRSAILLIVGMFDENRGDANMSTTKGIPPAAKRLLDFLWAGSYR